MLGGIGNERPRATPSIGDTMNEFGARLRSVHLQNERLVWVRPPRDRSAAEHVSIFLDGELYRDRVEANSVIDDIQDDIADSWFVFVSMESVEARWLECPCYEPFASFIATELLPWLSTRHHELGLVEKRTLIGLSYTGLAAAFVAIQCPGVFQRVISQSGSFWWNNCWLAEQYRSRVRVPTDFYLDVGTEELAEDVRHREDVLQVVSQVEGVRRFREVLDLKGYSVRYAEFEGGHDPASWRQTLPDALRWALHK
jgi:enterochelin esterase family protein